MHDFRVGERVVYEVARKDGGSFTVNAVVIAVTDRRVTVEFVHWEDGRLVRRAARPHRVSRP